MATISPRFFRARTIRSLWPGFTREKTETLATHSVKGLVAHLIQLFAGEGQIPLPKDA